MKYTSVKKVSEHDSLLRIPKEDMEQILKSELLRNILHELEQNVKYVKTDGLRDSDYRIVLHIFSPDELKKLVKMVRTVIESDVISDNATKSLAVEDLFKRYIGKEVSEPTADEVHMKRTIQAYKDSHEAYQKLRPKYEELSGMFDSANRRLQDLNDELLKEIELKNAAQSELEFLKVHFDIAPYGRKKLEQLTGENPKPSIFKSFIGWFKKTFKAKQ